MLVIKFPVAPTLTHHLYFWHNLAGILRGGGVARVSAERCTAERCTNVHAWVSSGSYPRLEVKDSGGTGRHVFSFQLSGLTMVLLDDVYYWSYGGGMDRRPFIAAPAWLPLPTEVPPSVQAALMERP